MDERIREIEKKLSSEYHRGELGIVSGEPIMEDIKYLLFHITTLEEDVRLAESIRETVFEYARGLKQQLKQSESRISTLEGKVKELESKENGLKHFIQHELKQISPRLETKFEQIESRIKEYEKDRHRLANIISRLREQHHDDCKLVIELRNQIKELEERIDSRSP